MSSRYSQQPDPPGSPNPQPADDLPGASSLPDNIISPPEKLTFAERYAAKCSRDFVQAFAGASSGLASGIVTCPLDVIKTKLQAQGGFRVRRVDAISIGQPMEYRGMVGTARTIWREEGLRGMYRGLGPITMGYLPTWAVYFPVYNRSKDYFGELIGPEREWASHLVSSIVAGACSNVVTNPIWVIKTRLMSQSSHNNRGGNRPPWHYNSTLDAARKMYRNEGIRSFYSGLAPSLLGLTHVAVQFPLYERFKRYFTGSGMGKRKEGEKLQPMGVLAASCLSKICASSATYPHEVIRTRLQTQQRNLPALSPAGISYRNSLEDPLDPSGRGLTHSSSAVQSGPPAARYRGLIHTFKTILMEEGWRAFYAGMGTNMIRAVPASATTLLTYEVVIEFLLKSKESGERKIALDTLHN